jgi:hypothetical protein
MIVWLPLVDVPIEDLNLGLTARNDTITAGKTLSKPGVESYVTGTNTFSPSSHTRLK